VGQLWLPRGGVEQHWVGKPAGLSTSMGEATAQGSADAAAAYNRGLVEVGVATASWEAGGSVSMGVEEVSLVHLEAGGLALVMGGPRKFKRLPSHLEGPGFWPGAMAERKDLPEKVGV